MMCSLTRRRVRNEMHSAHSFGIEGAGACDESGALFDNNVLSDDASAAQLDEWRMQNGNEPLSGERERRRRRRCM